MKSNKILLTVSVLGVIALLGLSFHFTLKANSSNGQEKAGDEEVFKAIKSAYDTIDFFGEFEEGDEEVYDFYKEQYRKLLQCEIVFYDKQTQKEYYINEYNEMNYTLPGTHLIYGGGETNTYDPANYIYYFFDMDGDGTPELCITNEIRFIYIIKYDPDSDIFILWQEVPTTWTRLLGSRKLWFYGGGSPAEYAYFQLDQNGEEECSVRFYVEAYYNKETKQEDILYMLSLPKFADKSDEIPEAIKAKAVYDEFRDAYFFSVTGEQWEELTNEFFEAREIANESIGEVRFTYTELFEGSRK